jgi:hypothetical protein
MILVACEYSSVVRDAFRALGYDAWSNDLLPTEGDPAWHIQGDCVEVIKSRRWDLIILHIPCTAMGVCGNRTYGRGKPKHAERLSAMEWSLGVWDLAIAHADRVALENPASVIFPHLKARGANVQYIQPFQHGHPEQKKTGLALHNLPPLLETNNVYEQMMALPRKERERIFFMSPSADRGKERARFYTGVATAMADQWGKTVGRRT